MLAVGTRWMRYHAGYQPWRYLRSLGIHSLMVINATFSLERTHTEVIFLETPTLVTNPVPC
jgi:hypothetical protein